MNTVASAPEASVLLVDDHAVIAVPLRMALESSGFGPVVAADADDLSPEAVLATARSMRPDIVLLDLHLGGSRTGLPLIAPLVEIGASVVLFTASNDPRLIATSLRAGAVAVIDKATPFDRLVDALTCLVGGMPLLTADERNGLIEALEAHLAEEDARWRPFLNLTAREAQVLGQLVDGWSPKEIARSEGISVSTVRGHINGILAKLGVSSQREALAQARAAGWPLDDRVPAGASILPRATTGGQSAFGPSESVAGGGERGGRGYGGWLGAP